MNWLNLLAAGNLPVATRALNRNETLQAPDPYFARHGNSQHGYEAHGDAVQDCEQGQCELIHPLHQTNEFKSLPLLTSGR